MLLLHSCHLHIEYGPGPLQSRYRSLEAFPLDEKCAPLLRALRTAFGTSISSITGFYW